MMMRCLIEGGMDGSYDDRTEVLNELSKKNGGYIPNPNGFYQLNEDFDRGDLYQKYDGKLFKFPFKKLHKLPTGQYKIIFLKRNPEEIRLSMRAFNPEADWGEDMAILDTYESEMNKIINKVKNKSNITITVLNYADVVKDPVKEFTKIKDAGWPIDVEKAAAMVEPELYRLRLEIK
jgi:hypothetical protein